MTTTLKLTALALTVLLGLAGSRPASACTTVNPRYGLTLADRFPETLPRGGVLAISASAYATSVEQAALELTELRVTRDDVEVPGAHEFIAVADGDSYDVLQFHPLVLVWRPEQPLAVGDALVVHYSYGSGFDFVMDSTPVTVVDAPTTVTLPEVLLTGGAVQVDESERVCCEVDSDSCNQTKLCLPTRAERVASVFMNDPRLGAPPQAYLWAARIGPGGEMGPRLTRSFRFFRYPPSEPAWATWPEPIVFPAGRAAPYCVVLGATSLIDGTSIVSDPHCITRLDDEDGKPVELGPIELEPDLPAYALERYRECISAPVYEADGSPYPPREATGCRTTSREAGAAPLLLLTLGLLHRRRTRRGKGSAGRLVPRPERARHEPRPVDPTRARGPQ